MPVPKSPVSRLQLVLAASAALESCQAGLWTECQTPPLSHHPAWLLRIPTTSPSGEMSRASLGAGMSRVTRPPVNDQSWLAGYPTNAAVASADSEETPLFCPKSIAPGIKAGAAPNVVGRSRSKADSRHGDSRRSPCAEALASMVAHAPGPVNTVTCGAGEGFLVADSVGMTGGGGGS